MSSLVQHTGHREHLRRQLCDVVVVGAGPAGSAAAAWAARAGRDVLVVDAATFPRDKACGDGLTPRAVAELQLLGLGPWLDEHIRHHGLRMTGFGSSVEVKWPGPSFPATGSAVPRTELDERIRKVAEASGARMLLGVKAVDVEYDSAHRVTAVLLEDGARIQCRSLIVADGARSTLGRVLGRQWHQETVYGVAARGYLASPRADEPWISSTISDDRPLMMYLCPAAPPSLVRTRRRLPQKDLEEDEAPPNGCRTDSVGTAPGGAIRRRTPCASSPALELILLCHDERGRPAIHRHSRLKA